MTYSGVSLQNQGLTRDNEIAANLNGERELS